MTTLAITVKPSFIMPAGDTRGFATCRKNLQSGNPASFQYQGYSNQPGIWRKHLAHQFN